MRITVLGKSPSWQDIDGACSGYLIEEGETGLLLDCGNGVFSKLRRFRDYTKIDAVVISHLHADHFLDLVPFSYALTYAPRQQPVPVDRWPGTDNPARPRLIAPQGARETFRRVVGAWGNDDLIENAFDLHEYDGAEPIELGKLRLRF
ncbi:MAG: MBL fold metallo-hydrolase, partial [Solirubrobacteraceae bacterium]